MELVQASQKTHGVSKGLGRMLDVSTFFHGMAYTRRNTVEDARFQSSSERKRKVRNRVRSVVPALKRKSEALKTL